MGKSSAERQRNRRECLKAEGKYDAYKKTQSAYRKQWAHKKKQEMSSQQKQERRERERKRKSEYRARLKQGIENQNLPRVRMVGSPVMNPATLNRAIKRVQSRLPVSPRKRQKVVQKLAVRFSPETFLPPSKRREAAALSSEVVSDVVHFYEHDDISSQAPGKNDFIILRENGHKTKVQKRYLILTVGEAYEQFKLAFPDAKIGKSKFAEFRPKHVCLRSETPANICLCIYHENIRLILQSLPDLPKSTDDFVKKVVCHDKSEKCMCQSQKECHECDDLKLYDELVESLIDDDTEIQYKQWVKAEDERLTRQTLCDTVQNVVALLRSKLTDFLQHVFIKRVQSDHFNCLKNSLPVGTVLVHTDFSENFAHNVQDEIQSVYWDTQSSTLYTAMVYYTEMVEGAEVGPLKSEPYVIISNYKNHDKYAVVVFNEIIIEHFKSNKGVAVSQIEYQTDGTAQHFKQKFTLCSLTLQGVPSRWNFSATSHGKGCIDGIGGTVKRRVSEKVRAEKLDIPSSSAFSKLAMEACPNINILHVDNDAVEAQKPKLDATWNPGDQEIRTLPGTRSAHFFEAVAPYVIRYALHSAVNVSKQSSFSFLTGKVHQTIINSEEVPSQSSETQFSKRTAYACGQWVDVEYESGIFHGLILDVKEGRYRISCLRLDKSGKTYVFEPDDHTVWYTADKIRSHMVNEPILLNARGIYKI